MKDERDVTLGSDDRIVRRLAGLDATPLAERVAVFNAILALPDDDGCKRGHTPFSPFDAKRWRKFLRRGTWKRTRDRERIVEWVSL